MRKKLLLEILFLAGLFVLPFVFWPKSSLPYEVPRVVFFQRWVEILAVALLILNLESLKELSLDATLLAFLVGFYLFSFLSSLLGVNFEKSFWGNYFRNDGLLTLSHLIGLSILVGLFVKDSWLRKVDFVLSISSVILSLWSLVNWHGQVGVSFGNANFLAGFLLITLPFTFGLTPLATIPQIMAILFTKALSPILGVAFFLLLLFLIRPKSKGKKYLIFTLPIILATITMLGVIIIFDQLDKAKISNQYIAENRTRIFVKGILAASKKPILGWGWANFDYAFDSVDWPIKFENDVWVDKAHSNILEVLVTSGLIGFFFYLAILIKTFWNLFKKLGIASPYSLAFILFVFHSQTNIISISEELLFWLIVGLSARRKV